MAAPTKTCFPSRQLYSLISQQYYARQIIFKITLRKLAKNWNALCEHRISVLDFKASFKKKKNTDYILKRFRFEIIPKEQSYDHSLTLIIKSLYYLIISFQ